jgi:hypothetical protein
VQKTSARNLYSMRSLPHRLIDMSRFSSMHVHTDYYGVLHAAVPGRQEAGSIPVLCFALLPIHYC